MKYPEPTVGAVIYNQDDKIFLCKSHKWNNKYVIPGGHIELGENRGAKKRNIRRHRSGNNCVYLN